MEWSKLTCRRGKLKELGGGGDVKWGTGSHTGKSSLMGPQCCSDGREQSDTSLSLHPRRTPSERRETDQGDPLSKQNKDSVSEGSQHPQSASSRAPDVPHTKRSRPNYEKCCNAETV